jgi:hypothetical protein
MYSFSFTNNNNLSNKIGKRKTKKLPRNKLMMLPVDYQPEATDVLCGRGNMYSVHPGNQCFQRIICDHMNAYSNAENRSDKIKIVDNVLCEVRNSGARIVKIDSKTKRWYELNDVKSHQKCGHCLRDTIRSNVKENKINSNSNSNSNSNRRIKSASIAIKKQKRQHKQLVDFFSAGTTGGQNLQHRLSLLADCSSDFLLNEENYLVLSTTTTTADSNRSSSFLLFDNEFPEDDLNFSPSTFFSQTA